MKFDKTDRVLLRIAFGIFVFLVLWWSFVDADYLAEMNARRDWCRASGHKWIHALNGCYKIQEVK